MKGKAELTLPLQESRLSRQGATCRHPKKGKGKQGKHFGQKAKETCVCEGGEGLGPTSSLRRPTRDGSREEPTHPKNMREKKEGRWKENS